MLTGTQTGLSPEPLQPHPPLTIADNSVPVHIFLEDRGLVPKPDDESNIRWALPNRMEMGSHSIRARAPARDGELLATTSGIAILDAEGTARMASPLDRVGQVRALIPLADRPSEIAPVVPPVLSATATVDSGGVQDDNSQSHVVSRPTIEAPLEQDRGPSGGRKLVAAVAAGSCAIGFVLFRAQRHLKH